MPGGRTYRVNAEGILRGLPHRREVDAQAPQQIGLTTPRARQDADGDQVIQLRLQDVWPKARSLKNRRGTAVILLGKPDQDMFRADVIVAQALGFLI